MAEARLPPEHLMRRVGWDIHARRPGDVFAERGRQQWALIKSLLPQGWAFDGRSVLDFGCGVGRILLPALDENPEAEYHGCDIDAPSIDWLAAQVAGRAEVFQTGELPPMRQPDEKFDLVYAFSVFTHLVDSWSAWLVELHRVLKDDGILIATVFGPGHDNFAGEPLAEDIIGMNVIRPWTPWSGGGPLVAHSQWWLRARWGRAFDIVRIEVGDPAGPPPLFGQGVVVMRKRPGRLSVEDLERPEPDEPREWVALRQNILSLRRELDAHTVYLTSRSWRVTAPLRAAGRLMRRRRRRRSGG